MYEVAAITIEDVQTVLTIAGFDPSSGAGVTADLKVFAAHGLFGTSCITGLTVQSTTGVRASYPVEAATIAATLACLDEDLPPAGIKIGMLSTREVVLAVCNYLEHRRDAGAQIPVVLDPVVRSSSGKLLLEPSGIEALRIRLLPMVDWVTPNYDELACLITGLSLGEHITREQIVGEAKALQQSVNAQSRRPLNVLVTGGELIPPDDLLLAADGTPCWMTGEHVETTSTHGTGCALSSALMCRLVLGDDPETAARNAKAYVAQALQSATPIGHGRGPMNHLWPLLNH